MIAREPACSLRHCSSEAEIEGVRIVWSVILDTLGALAVLASVAAQIALLYKQ